MTTAQPGQEQRMVTDAMIEAGAEALCIWEPDDNPSLVVESVYAAMEAARPTADLGDDGELVEATAGDDEEARAFIAGWNAARSRKYDFDMAMHWWLRERCGI